MKTGTIVLLLAVATFCASCASNEQLQERMDKRNERYMKYTERHEIRTDARQKRTDAWYDHHMN